MYVYTGQQGVYSTCVHYSIAQFLFLFFLLPNHNASKQSFAGINTIILVNASDPSNAL